MSMIKKITNSLVGKNAERRYQEVRKAYDEYTDKKSQVIVY